MTNTSAPRQAARDEFADTYYAHGWSMFGTSDRLYGFNRATCGSLVAFTAAGAVKWAERRTETDTAVARAYVLLGDTGKRETVLAWLTEADEPAAEVPAEAEPARSHFRNECPNPENCPTGEHSAPMERLFNERKRQRREADEQAAEQPLPEGVYATLDAAERGQALASLDRLAELAGGDSDMAGQAYRALVRDHVSIVRQRIAELEGENGRRQEGAFELWERVTELGTECDDAERRVGNMLDRAERAERRIAELESALERREDQVVGYQQSLGRANARIAELEARDAAAQEMLARAVAIERERDNAQANYDNLLKDWNRDQDRIGELEAQAARMIDTALAAQNDWNTDRSRLTLRIVDLEREVERLAGVDAAAAESAARVAELEGELCEVRRAAQGSGMWTR
jgi:predicted  nucleic acid-binding Zn-ribbon protein